MPTSPAPDGAPLSRLAELEPLLFQAGDLPGAVAAESAGDPAPPGLADDPPPAAAVGRRLVRDGRTAGSVSLRLYASPLDLARAYQRLTADADPFSSQPSAMEPRADVGDQAAAGRQALASSTYGPTTTLVVIVARCHAIVDVRLSEERDLTLDSAVAYARRVDQRIAAIVCR